VQGDCPTPGCTGIGHVKGAKFTGHHRYIIAMQVSLDASVVIITSVSCDAQLALGGIVCENVRENSLGREISGGSLREFFKRNAQGNCSRPQCWM